MWITPVWQTVIAVFSGIVALVVVPTMLDRAPSTYHTIPRYTRDAIVNYWLPQTTLPLNESTSQLILEHDLPHTPPNLKNSHTTWILMEILTSEGSTVNLATVDCCPAIISERFVNLTASKDGLLMVEASDIRLELPVCPFVAEERLSSARTVQYYTWVWWLLPNLGVFAIALILIYCIWSTMTSIRVKRRVAANHDFIQRTQSTSSTASQPALITVPSGNMPGDIMEYFGQESFIPGFMAKFDDYKKEWDLHMVEELASTEQNAKQLEQRISSLENICKDLLADKLCKEFQISDLQKQQKKLLDGLNGARAELQRFTGAEPKRKRQRAKARSAAEEPLRKGAEDSAVKDQISEETPSAASPNRNPHTPTPVNQPECRSEELPTKPPTGSETTNAGLKEKLAHDVPIHPFPTPCETEEQAKVQDTAENLEAPQPLSPKFPADYQTTDVDPEASSNLTGDAYYDILGIQIDATPDAIKKAYKRRAKELHPDKNAGNDSAQEDFTLLGEAYEVLYDSKQRELYDQSRISGTPFQPVPASDGFIFDPNPAPPAMTPVASDTVRHFLEKMIEERIDRLKKAKPDGWKLSTMAARPIALAQLLEEEPDQPWPES